MKKIKSSIVLVSFLATLFFPQVSLAAWYNPFSWFKKNDPVSAQNLNKPIPVNPNVNTNIIGNGSTSLKLDPVTTTPKKVSPPTPVKLTNAQIIKKVKPAVVYIETRDGAGSGMIIDSNGFILTNAHVVEGYENAQITLSTGDIYPALVIGKDENLDLAILKIEGQNFPKLVLGNSDNVAQGDEVFTLGFPFGIKGDVSFKDGTISRRIDRYLETSAEIQPGNSGGPLVDRYGRVVGINTLIYGKTVSGIQLGETIKLAIPINIAKNNLVDLKAGKNTFSLPPVKPEMFDEFAIFVKQLKDASNMQGNAHTLNRKAIDYAVDEDYYSGYLKINEAISVLSSSITLLKSIPIPPVSFSEAVKSILDVNIELYQFDLQTFQIQSTAYRLLSNPSVSLSEQRQALDLIRNSNYRGDQRHEFMVSTYFPKLGVYVAAAKPYLDIIYPKK